MTEEHLQAVLSQGRKVLVEAWVHEPQQLPQVHLQEMHVAEPLPVCQDLHPQSPPMSPAQSRPTNTGLSFVLPHSPSSQPRLTGSSLCSARSTPGHCSYSTRKEGG